MLRSMMFAGALSLCPLQALPAETPSPPGIHWQGSLAFGAELNPQGLPQPAASDSSELTPFRIGLAASWSLSVHWDRGTKPGPEPSQGIENTVDESALIAATNAERLKAGLPPLMSDKNLMKIAREHALGMARVDRLSHDLGGQSFSQRLRDSQFQVSRAAENIAQGQRTSAEAVSSWMNSPGHKSNILERAYTRIGVGKGISASGQSYWVQVFAAP